MSTTTPVSGVGSAQISPLSDIDPHSVTISGLVLDSAYGPGTAGNVADSLSCLDRDIGAPGKFPYTRGLFPEGYRSRLWTMRQFAGFGSADDTNRRFKYLLEQSKAAGGASRTNTGLSTAFDLPTLM